MEATPVTTLKIGIADSEEMKARTLRIARGDSQLDLNVQFPPRP